MMYVYVVYEMAIDNRQQTEERKRMKREEERKEAAKEEKKRKEEIPRRDQECWNQTEGATILRLGEFPVFIMLAIKLNATLCVSHSLYTTISTI